MARAKAVTVKGMSNVGAQAVVKTSARRIVTLVIRLKGGKYASTDKPLDEGVLHNVDQQLVDPSTFVRCFHGNMVIGLQCKYRTKRVNSKVLKVKKIGQFHLT